VPGSDFYANLCQEPTTSIDGCYYDFYRLTRGLSVILCAGPIVVIR